MSHKRYWPGRQEELDSQLARSDEWHGNNPRLPPASEWTEASTGEAPEVKSIAEGSDTPDVKLNRRQKRELDAIGNALSDASAAYDRVRAEDERIDKSIETLRTPPHYAGYVAALNLAKALNALYPIGRYRIAWVNAARDGIMRLSAEHHGLSKEEAERQLKSVEQEHEARLGSNPPIWALSAPGDDVVPLMTEMATDIGLGDARVPRVRDNS